MGDSSISWRNAMSISVIAFSDLWSGVRRGRGEVTSDRHIRNIIVFQVVEVEVDTKVKFRISWYQIFE